MTSTETAGLTENLSNRYVRQIGFKPIGPDGQRRLAGASVVLVGCGALGSVLANHMARAGLGRLRIIDRDVLEVSNLPRQMLYDERDVTRHAPKAEAAAARLAQINSAIELDPLVVDLHAGNVLCLLRGFDLLLDGTDNFSTRYLLNEACQELNIPWVYTGVVASYGMSLAIASGKTACLRCVLGPMPSIEAVPTIYTQGIIGPAVAAIASISAASGLRILVEGDQPVQSPISPRLVSIDVWDLSFETLDVGPPRIDCPACGSPAAHEYLGHGQQS